MAQFSAGLFGHLVSLQDSNNLITPSSTPHEEVLINLHESVIEANVPVTLEAFDELMIRDLTSYFKQKNPSSVENIFPALLFESIRVKAKRQRY